MSIKGVNTSTSIQYQMAKPLRTNKKRWLAGM
jgi:hypothetical protein